MCLVVATGGGWCIVQMVEGQFFVMELLQVPAFASSAAINFFSQDAPIVV